MTALLYRPELVAAVLDRWWGGEVARMFGKAVQGALGGGSVWRGRWARARFPSGYTFISILILHVLPLAYRVLVCVPTPVSNSRFKGAGAGDEDVIHVDDTNLVLPVRGGAGSKERGVEEAGPRRGVEGEGWKRRGRRRGVKERGEGRGFEGEGWKERGGRGGVEGEGWKHRGRGGVGEDGSKKRGGRRGVEVSSCAQALPMGGRPSVPAVLLTHR